MSCDDARNMIKIFNWFACFDWIWFCNPGFITGNTPRNRLGLVSNDHYCGYFGYLYYNRI